MTVTRPVSALVVSWNCRELLGRCLASLQASGAEVVVVDNASSDGSADMVASAFPGATLVRSPRNLGFAGALNEAARHAHGRYLLFLNPDTEVTPDAVSRLVSFAEQNPRCGAVAGRLIDEAGRPQPNVRRFPTLAVWAVELLLLHKVWPSNPVTARYLARDLTFDTATNVDQPAAACLLVRREAFDRVTGLDEEFQPAWFEDVDFCRRLHDAGWTIAVVPDAVCRHRGGVAMRTLGLGAFLRAWYRNLERYARKHHGVAAYGTLKILIVVGMLERAAASLLTARPRHAVAYLRVLGDTLTHWR